MQTTLFLIALSVALTDMSKSAPVTAAPAVEMIDDYFKPTHSKSCEIAQREGLVVIRDAATSQRICSITLKNKDAEVALSSDNTKLAEVSEDAIHIYDVATGKLKKTIAAPYQENRALEALWSPDGTRLLTRYYIPQSPGSSAYDAKIFVLDAETGKVLYNIERMETITPIVFSSDSKALLIPFEDDKLYRVDIATSAKTVFLDNNDHNCELYWNPQYSILAIVTRNPDGVSLYDAKGKLILHTPDPVGATAEWDAEGKILLLREGHEGVLMKHVIDTETKKVTSSEMGPPTD